MEMSSIYERERDGMTRNQWTRRRHFLKSMGINYHVKLPKDITVADLIKAAEKLRRGETWIL